ncbi:neutral/alkaline non-lysosomal ceramidase N-terminal domain-containing protein [Pseudonocardia aurantiaca]|uniref:Alkaline ceramidase n=1 Tax=Pseudonocardia aurantiaca TaxID=75290 RepID=A0ABW4FLC7_9PSEU
MTVLAGVASRDITPPAGAAMSGFAARETPATGVHDSLLVHALVVGDTALVTVDVVGLHEDDCAEIRARCGLPPDHVVVHATHTHGGPVSMRGRLGDPLDEAWLATVVRACAESVAEASARREPVSATAGYGGRPAVARNRRRPGGPVDDEVPVVLLRRSDGSLLAGVVSYACHPVVLGADNTLFTADYPGVVRRVMAERLGGGPVLFVTGCAGDANTGHTAAASISTAASADRTFEACERVGKRIAAAGLALTPRDRATRPGARPAVAAVASEVRLELDVPDRTALLADLERWEQDAAEADSAHRALRHCWIGWGRGLLDHPHPRSAAGHLARVTVLRWDEAMLVALPGEPFAAAAHEIREHAARKQPDATVLVAGYSNGCPGYLPTSEEYPHGGYEVCDAHRYYGMPGPFSAGSSEALVKHARQLLDRVL